MLQNKLSRIPQSASAIAGALLMLLIVLTATTWRPALTNQLHAWKLLPEPEKLTELYFTQPNKLPSTYVPGQTQNIDFTVHNIEYQTMTYHYTIVEETQDGHQKQTLTSSSFTLKQNQYRQVSFAGSLTDMGANATVVVELPTVHETIDYIVTRSAQ